MSIGTTRRMWTWATAIVLIATAFVTPGIAAEPSLNALPAVNWRPTYRQAWEESKKTGKPMFVTVSAKWCGACRTLQSQVLSQPQVATAINENCIPVIIDADQQPQLVQAFRISAMPTCVVVQPDLKITDRLVGMQAAEKVVERVNIAGTGVRVASADPTPASALEAQKP